MSQQTIELNDELVAVLHSLNQPVRQSVPELVVWELYRRGLISSGGVAGVGAALGETPVSRHLACHGFDRWTSSE